MFGGASKEIENEASSHVKGKKNDDEEKIMKSVIFIWFLNSFFLR